MQEEWKDIVIEKNGVVYDYTGLYQVSNLGRVKSLGNGKTYKKERIKKTKPNKNGYVSTILYKNGNSQRFYVHRLVATMFIPNPNNLPEVNHISEVKHNNCVENLEWCDRDYNANYGTIRERQSVKGKERANRERVQRSERMKGKFEGSKHPKARKVICIETGQVFDCIKEASEWCGGNVRQCCIGKSKTAGGYTWNYTD